MHVSANEGDQRRRPPIGRCCDWIGCCAEAPYRAPRSRTKLNDYWWFCLEHVRQYNAAWNYYAGMSEAEIEADLRHDTVWRRPSWPLGGRPPSPGDAGGGYADPFGLFGETSGPAPAARALSPEAQALVILDLKPPVTIAIVKARYRVLVKAHHPDANGGDKGAEERFKQISEAYRTVMTSLGA